ncbi:hypothetical protein ACFQDG_08525 [Natronoarchaeum mannanilyticum]|uniref:hypothetical protein n=1 Tax=Natronoarchaeum mannanilyticum TaxID=926360 RepID=UPI00360E9051
MKLPRGQLVRSRVVSNPGTSMATMLDRELTGYALLEPQEALLLDADERGVLTFEDGVPVLAYHTGTDRGGVEALADLAVPGPYSVDVFELSAADVDDLHDTPDLTVPPGMPVERVAGDPELAARTRERARSLGLDAPAGAAADASGASQEQEDPVATFLENGEKIDAIREQAREESEQRAREWGLAGELADGAD